MPVSSNLSMELLQTFVEVMDAGGNAMAAAEKLGINQPSMSKRLKSLQYPGPRLPRPWLVRVGKDWRPTDEGQQVLPAVRDVVRRLRRLGSAIEAGRSSRLTFGCGQEAAGGIVLRAVQRFRELQPGAACRVITLRGQERILGVANGYLDLAIVTDEPERIRALARQRLHVEDLFDDPLMLACAEGSPWSTAFRALPTRASARMLASFPLVLPDTEAGLRQQFDRRLQAAGVLHDLDVVAEVGGWPVLLAYVQEGVGVGLLPRSVCTARPEGLQVRALDSALAPMNRLRLICRHDPDRANGLKRRDLNADGEAFRVALLDAARTLRRGGSG